MPVPPVVLDYPLGGCSWGNPGGLSSTHPTWGVSTIRFYILDYIYLQDSIYLQYNVHSPPLLAVQ